MNLEHNRGLISDLDLERYVSGELPAEANAAMDARLAVDPDLVRKVREMRSQDQAFAVRFPAETLVPQMEAAARRSMPQPFFQKTLQKIIPKGSAASIPFGMGHRQVWAFALLVLCALPVILWKTPVAPVQERLKGKQAELRLYRNTLAGVERVASGTIASVGDVFQMEFHPGASSYGAIVSVDGNGSVTLHWPAHAKAATAWTQLPEHRLPEAFQLDDSPEFERFHLLMSTAPLDLKAWLSKTALSAAQDESWLAAQAPESVSVLTIALKKRP